MVIGSNFFSLLSYCLLSSSTFNLTLLFAFYKEFSSSFTYYLIIYSLYLSLVSIDLSYLIHFVIKAPISPKPIPIPKEIPEYFMWKDLLEVFEDPYFSNIKIVIGVTKKEHKKVLIKYTTKIPLASIILPSFILFLWRKCPKRVVTIPAKAPITIEANGVFK